MVKKTPYIFLSLIVSLIANHVKAQADSTSFVTGLVVEKTTKEPMEFVNIAMYNTADSSFVTGVVTDKNGKYKITEIDIGTYYLKISFIGFESTIEKF